ncbi:MAG: type II toxin-antitoxin system VapC family toxin [Beijerinckiaceae bacterium]
MLLLDSNALIWLVTRPERLSPGAKAALSMHRGPLHLSLASIWEIEIKRSLGKLALDGFGWDAPEFTGSLTIVEITFADVIRAARLPSHHRDPFDRMLIAQALNRNATILTSDAAFGLYGVPIIPA